MEDTSTKISQKEDGLILGLTLLALFTLAAGMGLLPSASTGTAATLGVALPSPTPTVCPVATPEWFWVEPVTSPTEQLTQTIFVGIGNGEAVTVTAESGLFAVTGDVDWYNVGMTLLPNTTHHLTVYAKVKTIKQGGCTYGGYTLSTTHDRYGAPLIIVQQSAPLSMTLYLPIVIRGVSNGELDIQPDDPACGKYGAFSH